MREASKHWLVVAGALIASSAVTGRVARAAEGRDGEEPLVLERILARRFDIASDSVDAAVLAAFQNREAHDATPAKGAAAATEPVRFQIPAGRLDAALSAFEEQSGYTVEIGNPLLNEISSKGVSGLYSPEKALEILLDGTSVAFEKSPSTCRWSCGMTLSARWSAATSRPPMTSGMSIVSAAIDASRAFRSARRSG